jgi:hypothetical protein
MINDFILWGLPFLGLSGIMALVSIASGRTDLRLLIVGSFIIGLQLITLGRISELNPNKK